MCLILLDLGTYRSLPTFPVSRHSAARSSSAKVRENEPKRFEPLEAEDVGCFGGTFMLGDVVL